MSKVINFPPDYFDKNNEPSLTPSMIAALKKGCEMQNKKIPFGQKDIDGCFNALLTRGLIKSRISNVDGSNEVHWYVTDLAIKLLKDLGISDPC